MSDYQAISKTDWFVQKMRSGWFSYRQLVDLAVAEFSDIPVKKLEGTLGQYWSDCVNEKWPISKAIRGRGLKVVEAGGRRSVVDDSGASTSSSAGDKMPALNAFSPRTARGVPVVAGLCSPKLKLTVQGGRSESKTRDMWNGNDREVWEQGLNRYWRFVAASNLALEKEMDQLDAAIVRGMDPQEWYRFLLEEYFRWKYTAPNRYASTTKWLRSYEANNELLVLHGVKDRLFRADKGDIQQCLALASSIRGLGTAGASGLLAVLFPAHFGTVDQFEVKALSEVPELPEKDLIAAMNPESLKLNEGVILIQILRRKAGELNRVFSTTDWTPRKADMVLWTCAR